ncbi:hypothetical protein [Acidisphaera sp. S103]|uniref:hypothetical protein n=1 Tax=Acidisphaera sp. S103 TaxID=1747223 RepID=UPI00131BD22E|nr:hypothetical protein [Acidisphaera sp. S103]
MTQPPNNPLLGFVLNLLTPFLIAGGLTDPALARQAAEQAVAAYQEAGNRQLLTIAQITAFALAALDNLRLSLPQDLSLSMKLKLRSNANALNRASQTATATLETQRRDAPEPAEIPASLETAKTPPEPKPGANVTQTDLAWAAAMTDVAAEYTTELPNLPPAQHRTHLARVSALSNIAHMLGTGQAPPLKARLLGSTAIQGSAPIPAP